MVRRRCVRCSREAWLRGLAGVLRVQVWADGPMTVKLQVRLACTDAVRACPWCQPSRAADGYGHIDDMHRLPGRVAAELAGSGGCCPRREDLPSSDAVTINCVGNSRTGRLGRPRGA